MRHLMDTSASWQGRLNEKAKSRMISLSESGDLAVCSLAMMEILFSAKNSHEWRAMREALGSLPRVLHYDRDFERLCAITGGAHEWVVPAGSGH